MKIYTELNININKEEKQILFGIPDNEKELKEMFNLRFLVYSQRKYIEPDKYTDNEERDEYDKEGGVIYFIAKIDDEVIGTVRLIKNDPLPTEKDFNFSEPEVIKKIPRNMRVELSRLIIIPSSFHRAYFPKGLVMLLLIRSALMYTKENNIKGGYAFIKKTLEEKMVKRKMPIHQISNYKQTYPKDGVLYGYFNQENDPVIPIYFLVEEFESYTNELLGKWLMFERLGENKYKLRENIYNFLLKTLRYI